MSSAVAVYYGVEIPEVLLAAEMQNHSAKSLGEARAQAGRALAAKAVLLATARELELKAQPEKNTHGQEETIEEALVRAVLSEEIDVEAPSDADLRVIYDRNPEGFTTPPLLEASHILLAPKEESDTALSAARLEAERLIADLSRRNASFERCAATQSACPSAAEGGSLGQLRPGDVLADIWDALEGMAVGEIGAKPIQTMHGWHVLRLDHRADGERLPFEHVRPHISAKLEARAWTVAAARFVDELLQESAANPGLKLTELGGLAEAQSELSSLSGLLGEALADSTRALASLSEDARAIVLAASETRQHPAEQVLREAIGTFLNQANDEAWTKIISRLRDGASPLSESLDVIVSEQLPPLRAKRTLILTRGGASPASTEKGQRHGTG